MAFLRTHLSTVILAVALVVVSVASLFIGVLDMEMAGLMSGDPDQWLTLLASRLPRLLAILCTGIGMSVAGLIMQQLCMNKFVSPTTGATIQSAQFGVLLAMLFMPAAGIWGRSLFAFACAAIGTWIFVWFIQRIQFKDVVMVPLVGIMFGNIITGVTNFLAYKYDMTQALSTWLVGHFSMVLRGRYELVWLVVPLVILAFVFANHFNIVGMGKDFSKNLGVHYNAILVLGLTIAAFITASVVVTVGSISYIGLIVPNVVAMFKGDKIRGTLVDVALFGALFVLVCDIVARTVIAPYELPIELIVGIIGSVIFIGLLLYRLDHGRAAVRRRGPKTPSVNLGGGAGTSDPTLAPTAGAACVAVAPSHAAVPCEARGACAPGAPDAPDASRGPRELKGRLGRAIEALNAWGRPAPQFTSQEEARAALDASVPSRISRLGRHRDAHPTVSAHLACCAGATPAATGTEGGRR